MRLGGLASGMDTDSMVEQMMKAESMKVDRVEADKKKLEWKKETLNDLNKDFANFVLDSKKDLGYNSLGKPGSQDWATNATSSDDTVGTARAGTGALEGNHKLTDIKLAKGLSGVSIVEVEDTKIGAFKFKLNDKEISIGESDSLNDIAKKINAAGAGVQASYDKGLKRFFINSDKEGLDAKFDFQAMVGEDNEPDPVSSNKLNEFFDAIKVDMREYSGEIVEASEGAIKYNKLTVGSEITGTKGSATYNGLEVELKSNQPTFNGVKFNLIKEGDITVNVKTDADAIVDKVKYFVAEYNKIIEQASKLLTEKVDRKYSPLTDDEKEGLTDKQIEDLEKKAKSGIIARDDDVERILSSLRMTLYEELGTDGPFKFISDIGITTQKYSSGGIGGLLEINEDKLREKIAQDSDAVMDVLFKTSDKADKDSSVNASGKAVANQGLFNRIFDKVADGMKTLISKSGPGEHGDLFRKVKSNIMTDFVIKGGRYSGRGSVSDIDNDMDSYTKKIEQLRAQLAKKEEMYFAQFAAMEKAMYKANSQGDWLNQQMQSMF